jgi:hypothetical protein
MDLVWARPDPYTARVLSPFFKEGRSPLLARIRASLRIVSSFLLYIGRHVLIRKELCCKRRTHQG